MSLVAMDSTDRLIAKVFDHLNQCASLEPHIREVLNARALGFTKESCVMKSQMVASFAMVVLTVSVWASAAQAAPDAEAAKALARQNSCFKCHGTEKQKDGPSFKSVADKYRGKSDAEAVLTHHLTSGEKSKFPDGHEEAHKVVETSPPNDAAQIKNLVDWILSL
jgi:cytochrome c